MGVIQGGTEFVVAAYGVTAVVLGGYLVSLIVRFRRAASGRGNSTRSQ